MIGIIIGMDGAEKLRQIGSDRSARTGAIDAAGILIAGALEAEGVARNTAEEMVLDWREGLLALPDDTASRRASIPVAIAAYIRSRRTIMLRSVLDGPEPWWSAEVIPATQDAPAETIRDIIIANLGLPVEAV